MKRSAVKALSVRAGSLRFRGDCLCLHFVQSGQAVGLRGSHRHPIVEDTYLIQNVGTPHEIHANGTQVITLCFSPELVGNERFAECSTPHDHFVDRAISNFLTRGQQTAKAASGLEILRALIHARDESPDNFYLSAAQGEEMKSAREYILSRLTVPLSVPDVANHCAYSPFHFHRLFAQWHGITPGQYILKEKIRRACRKLVLTGESINAISITCGFLSPTTFAGTFKSSTGFTPGGFRRMASEHRPDLKFFLA